MQIKLSISQVPESYNKIAHWHWAKKRAYNKLWYDEIFYIFNGQILLKALPKFDKAKISFYIYFGDKHKRDKINFAGGLKAALDGLVRCGIIADDNWDNIDDRYYKLYDKNNPRTEIIIETKGEQDGTK